jgi:hypothetical protein
MGERKAEMNAIAKMRNVERIWAQGAGVYTTGEDVSTGKKSIVR